MFGFAERFGRVGRITGFGATGSYALFTGAMLAAMLTLRMIDPAPVAALRSLAFDTWLSLYPRVPPRNSSVRIVDIDEASLADLGQWPWPRTHIAALIEKLRDLGARVVAFDIIFAEPDRSSLSESLKGLQLPDEFAPLIEKAATLPSNDRVLASAMMSIPVVLGFAAEPDRNADIAPAKAPLAVSGDDPRLFTFAFGGATGSLGVLMDASAGFGAVNWLPERDLIVRRVPLLVSVRGRLYPALSLETLRVGGGQQETIFVRSSGGSKTESHGQKTGIETIRTAGISLPVTAQGELWMRFAPHDSIRTVSARDLLDGRVAKGEFEGSYVFVGSSATGLKDLRATPLKSSVAGVEIHAQALEQMLSGDHLSRPAWATGLELLFLLSAGLATAFLIYRAGALAGAAGSLAAVVLIIFGSALAFREAGFLVDPVYPALALTATYLTGSLLRYIQTEGDKTRIRRAFGHYVSPAIVEQLTRTPEKLKLGGERREVTLLFADVRGFSRYSEHLDAEDLVRFINELFTPLTADILAHQGTIDKFLGDAVMAFWNAPLNDTEHATRACQAALAMQASLSAINSGRKDPVLLGIGLNTGICVAGNVGSPERFDYSVLGDAVNTAARLEELTKHFGVPILAGETTARAAKGCAFTSVGETRLRGKNKPEQLYALLGDEMLASHPGFSALQQHYAAYAAAMGEGAVAEALRHLSACASLNVKMSKTVLDASFQRLEVRRTQPV